MFVFGQFDMCVRYDWIVIVKKGSDFVDVDVFGGVVMKVVYNGIDL